MMTNGCDIALVFPSIRLWDRPRNFPTGIGLLATILRNAGYNTAVIDANGLRLTEAQVAEQIEKLAPKIVGVGGLITTYGFVKKLCGLVRKACPKAKIILGGSVATSIIETALGKLDIDAIAVGEAERTILELMPALLANRRLDDIAGLAFMAGGNIVRTPERPSIEKLDDIPYPAWDLFPMNVYLANPVVGVGKDIDIISSRGCPFGCDYCYRLFGRKYRTRSAKHVVGEMLELKKNYDVDFVSFQDDCFVVDKKRVYEICDLIDADEQLCQIRWSCTGRVTICDAELLNRMRKSGCISVSYGIESGSEKILDAMNKAVSLEQAKRAINDTRAAGLRAPVSFMIGYPSETPETVMETVEFCKEMNIPLTALMFTCPYPGTELYEQVKNTENFKKQFDNEEEFVLKMADAVDFTVNLTNMQDEKIQSLRNEALKLGKANYRPPSQQEIDRQERQLYGERLYQKAQQQLKDPAMQAHRRRHGFNEKVFSD